jgi:hypothetical protein
VPIWAIVIIFFISIYLIKVKEKSGRLFFFIFYGIECSAGWLQRSFPESPLSMGIPDKAPGDHHLIPHDPAFSVNVRW